MDPFDGKRQTRALAKDWIKPIKYKEDRKGCYIKTKACRVVEWEGYSKKVIPPLQAALLLKKLTEANVVFTRTNTPGEQYVDR